MEDTDSSENNARTLTKPMLLGLVSAFLLVAAILAAGFIPAILGLDRFYHIAPLIAFVLIRTVISALSPAPGDLAQSENRVAFLVTQAQGLAALCFAYSALKLATTYPNPFGGAISNTAFGPLGQGSEKTALFVLGVLAFVILLWGFYLSKRLRLIATNNDRPSSWELLRGTILYSLSGFLATIYIVVAIPSADTPTIVENLRIDGTQAAITSTAVFLAFLLTILGNIVEGCTFILKRILRARNSIRFAKPPKADTVQNAKTIENDDPAKGSGEFGIRSSERVEEIAWSDAPILPKHTLSVIGQTFGKGAIWSIAYLAGACLFGLFVGAIFVIISLLGFAWNASPYVFSQFYDFLLDHLGWFIGCIIALILVQVSMSALAKIPEILTEYRDAQRIRAAKRKVRQREKAERLDQLRREQKLREKQEQLGLLAKEADDQIASGLSDKEIAASKKEQAIRLQQEAEQLETDAEQKIAEAAQRKEAIEGQMKQLPKS